MTPLVKDVIAGNRRAIARAMSILESRKPAQRALHKEMYCHAGKTHIVGITGVPGSGKSTLVQSVTKTLRLSGLRIGIIAIDPSSPFSGGAILGDRVRMGQLALDEGVFIRSMATRGALGGLARACLDAVDVLDVAGFDMVLIETVGVGQDEIDIASAAHTVVVASAPGLGDGVQAIKAGVLEIADIHVVTKCDKPDALRTSTDLNSMIKLGASGKDRLGWDVPVVSTSAETGEGIDALCALIKTHHAHLETSGEMQNRQREITEMRILKTAQDQLRDLLAQQSRGAMQELLEQTINREIEPAKAADQLIKRVYIE